MVTQRISGASRASAIEPAQRMRFGDLRGECGAVEARRRRFHLDLRMAALPGLMEWVSKRARLSCMLKPRKRGRTDIKMLLSSWKVETGLVSESRTAFTRLSSRTGK